MGLWRGLSEDGQAITIRRFDGRFHIPAHVTPQWISEHASEITTGAVIDVETTGLDRKNGRVIEIALRTFRFHKPTGALVAVDSSYSGLQDPGFPLSAEITEITGLTDQDLKGKSIDWMAVKNLLDPIELVIAHNAGFDRPFVEKELNQKIFKVWACSWSQIDWDKKGYSVHKLELLSAFHGFFTDAHRALNDVDALLNLLSFKDEETGQGYLSELYINANRTQVKIIASQSPFEAKDLLKAKGYRWNSEIRSWNKVEYTDLVPTEIQWLENEIYRGKFLGKMVEIPVLDRFRAD
jgi:DNA polymerase-3 subunit epsilon